eukprot:8696062-Alexandrium_andersonii.AAC.1
MLHGGTNYRLDCWAPPLATAWGSQFDPACVGKGLRGDGNAPGQAGVREGSESEWRWRCLLYTSPSPRD